MNIKIGWHAITIALCWVLPAHILLADIARNGARSETWASTASQTTELYLGIDWWWILLAPLIVGGAIEVAKRLPSKG